MFKTFCAYLLIAVFLSGSLPARADGLKQITSTSPSWNSFTNEDGTGLYHEILRAIFSPLKIRVVHKYTNAKRGVQLIRKGLADIYTCRNDNGGFRDLILAKYPMYEGKFYALFKKDRFPKWQGQESLSDKTVVWRRGYYKPHEFSAVFSVLEADSGSTALAQIVLGRGDFYIDDLNLIKESVAQNTLPFDMAEYDIRPVGSRTYHPVFLNSPRGRQILEIYTRGMERLHRSGRLKEIFQKWHHPYPDYKFP